MVAVAEIPRPLGLILEEREDGRGVEIIRVDPRGNAALSRADVLVGDRVLMVGDAACGQSARERKEISGVSVYNERFFLVARCAFGSLCMCARAPLTGGDLR